MKYLAEGGVKPIQIHSTKKAHVILLFVDQTGVNYHVFTLRFIIDGTWEEILGGGQIVSKCRW